MTSVRLSFIRGALLAQRALLGAVKNRTEHAKRTHVARPSVREERLEGRRRGDALDIGEDVLLGCDTRALWRPPSARPRPSAAHRSLLQHKQSSICYPQTNYDKDIKGLCCEAKSPRVD